MYVNKQYLKLLYQSSLNLTICETLFQLSHSVELRMGLYVKLPDIR